MSFFDVNPRFGTGSIVTWNCFHFSQDVIILFRAKNKIIAIDF